MPQPPDFDALYNADADPWQVATRWYEIRKLDVALASLSRPTYPTVWDVACGSGVAASRLAKRSGAVIATDASAAAIEATRSRIQGDARVAVAQSTLPHQPDLLRPPIELVFVSEILYYLDAKARHSTYELWDGLADPGSELLAVHWRPRPDDGYGSGDELHDELAAFLADRGWDQVVSHRDQEFVIHSHIKKEPTR